MRRKILLLSSVTALTLVLSCSRQSEQTSNAAPAANAPAAEPSAAQMQSAPPAAPVASAPAPVVPGAAAAPGGKVPGAKPSSAPAATSAKQGIAVGEPNPNKAAPAAPAPKVPKRYTAPEGTTIAVRTTNAITTKTAKDGDPFVGSLAEPLTDGDFVIAPKNAKVEGVVVNADPGGRVKGVATLSVKVTKLETVGGDVSIETGAHTAQAAESKKKDALKVGIGSGIGAAIGAIAGGGKGAAIGAAAGAGAGTGAVLATRGEAAVIPAETVLRFTLRNAVTVTK